MATGAKCPLCCPQADEDAAVAPSGELQLPPPPEGVLHLAVELHDDLLFAHIFLTAFRPQLKLKANSVSVFHLDRMLGSRSAALLRHPPCTSPESISLESAL